MDILTLAGVVGVMTTFTLTLFSVCYILRNVLGTVVIGN